MNESNNAKGGRKTLRYLLIRAFLIVFGLLLILPFLFYLTMTIVSALSRPEDPRAASKRGEALTDLRNQTIITISAHPDDIDYWASGTLAKLHQNGNIIIMVLGTSGEKGNSTPELGRIREKEQQKAGEIIGYDRIVFLRHPDRGLTADTKFKNELRQLFGKYKPDILFTFDIDKEGLIYHHSDHRAAGIAAHTVASEFDSVKKIYQFHSGAPNVIVDVSDVVDAKAEALDAHGSVRGQNGGLIRIPLALLALFARGDENKYRQYGLDNSFQKDLGIQYAEVFRVIDNHAR
jgi:LmbE family N-acetylglucosaminyl deacetylase